MKKIILSTLVVVGLSTAAYAQTGTDFATVDTDANGELSYVELQVAWPDLTQAEFDTADVDLSGGLTADELVSLQASGTGMTSSSEPSPSGAPAEDTGAVATPQSISSN